MRTVTTFLLIMYFIFQPLSVKASWFEDFSGSTIHMNNSSAWEAQKRGYFSGGGVYYRLETEQQPFVTITTPRLQASCGGIDMFWGGFSYLQPEYLIQSFKNIMSAAPAFAFKLALTSLCDQCDDVMSALEEMSQLINQMAMDECRGAQALVNAGGDMVASLVGSGENSGTNSGRTWLDNSLGVMNSNLADFNQNIERVLSYEYCGGFDQHGDADNWNKCMQQARITPGSFWATVAQRENSSANNSIGSFTVELLRGMFGDIEFSGNDTGSKIKKITNIASCANSDATSFLSAMLHVPASANDTGTYIQVKDNNQCLSVELPEGLQVGKKAATAIEKINKAMVENPAEAITNTADWNAVKDIVGQSSIPLYQIINTFAYRANDWGRGLGDGEKIALTNLAAISHAHYMLSKIIQKAEQLMHKYELSFKDKANVNGYRRKDVQEAFAVINRNIGIYREALARRFEASLVDYRNQIKDIMEYQRIKRYYQDLLRNKGLLVAYKGI